MPPSPRPSTAPASAGGGAPSSSSAGDGAPSSPTAADRMSASAARFAQQRSFQEKKKATYWPYPEGRLAPSQCWAVPRIVCNGDYFEGLVRAREFTEVKGWRTYEVVTATRIYDRPSAAKKPKHTPLWKLKEDAAAANPRLLYPKMPSEIQLLNIDATRVFQEETRRAFPKRKAIALSESHAKLQRHLSTRSLFSVGEPEGPPVDTSAPSLVKEGAGSAVSVGPTLSTLRSSAALPLSTAPSAAPSAAPSRPGSAATTLTRPRSALSLSMDPARRFRPPPTTPGPELPPYGVPMTTAEIMLEAERVARGVPRPGSARAGAGAGSGVKTMPDGRPEWRMTWDSRPEPGKGPKIDPIHETDQDPGRVHARLVVPRSTGPLPRPASASALPAHGAAAGHATAVGQGASLHASGFVAAMDTARSGSVVNTLSRPGSAVPANARLLMEETSRAAYVGSRPDLVPVALRRAGSFFPADGAGHTQGQGQGQGLEQVQGQEQQQQDRAASPSRPTLSTITPSLASPSAMHTGGSGSGSGSVGLVSSPMGHGHGHGHGRAHLGLDSPSRPGTATGTGGKLARPLGSMVRPMTAGPSLGGMGGGSATTPLAMPSSPAAAMVAAFAPSHNPGANKSIPRPHSGAWSGGASTRDLGVTAEAIGFVVRGSGVGGAGAGAGRASSPTPTPTSSFLPPMSPMVARR